MAGIFGFRRRAHRSPEVEAINLAIADQARRVAAVENTARAMLQGGAAKPPKPIRTIKPKVYPDRTDVYPPGGKTWMELTPAEVNELRQRPGVEDKIREIWENSNANRPRERREQGAWGVQPRGANAPHYIPFREAPEARDRKMYTGPRPDNAFVTIHSHPVPEQPRGFRDDYGFPYMPSPSDLARADEAGVPGLVVTDRGVFGYKMPPLW